MKETIVKTSYDIQSLILGLILFLLLIIPLLIYTIIFNNFVGFIILIILIIFAVISLLMIYFYTKIKITFQKSDIILTKRNKEFKRLKWHEVKIEYLGFSELIFLKSFCIQLSYYDKKIERYIDLFIPTKKDAFDGIMRLRAN